MLLAFVILIIFIMFIISIELKLCVDINDEKHEIYLKIYTLKKIRIGKIDLTKKRKNYKKNTKLKNKLRKITKKVLIKDLYNHIKNMELKLEKLNLKVDISTTDSILTSYIVAILANIVTFVLKIFNFKIDFKNCRYEINPLYITTKVLNIKLNCIISVNIVHIINIIYKNFMKWRCDINGRRTSNRRAYGNCNE